MTSPTVAAVEVRARRAAAFVHSDDGATWAFRAALLASLVVFFYIGRNQFFVRDDWAFVLSREQLLTTHGWDNWLFDPQDGHWMTVPILLYHVTLDLFGLDSYWPFLLPAMAAHVGAVLLTRVLCRRLGVAAWTTTLVCSMLLVFGAGWENMVFAIQITFNFSLVAFLAQIVLSDHDGPTDRRDVLGAVIGLIGVMSSGFGPIFIAGVFVFLALRRRWKAILIGVVPHAVIYGWWYLFWEEDLAAELRPGSKTEVPAFVARGISSTFDALVSLPGLGGIAMVATLAVALTRRFGPQRRSLSIALLATVIVMFTAISFERVGFGVALAASSRYMHFGGIILAPVFALAIDQLARISREARWAGLAVVGASAVLNLGLLHGFTVDWSQRSRSERDTYGLIVGSGLAAQADQDRSIFAESPDVHVSSLPGLVELGAVIPRAPQNAEEDQRVRAALGLPPP